MVVELAQLKECVTYLFLGALVWDGRMGHRMSIVESLFSFDKSAKLLPFLLFQHVNKVSGSHTPYHGYIYSPCTSHLICLQQFTSLIRAYLLCRTSALLGNGKNSYRHLRLYVSLAYFFWLKHAISSLWVFFLHIRSHMPKNSFTQVEQLSCLKLILQKT